MLLDFLRRHRDQFRPWEPDTPQTRTLQFLAEDRRMLVEEKTRQTHRLRARLKLYFPQIVEWFEDLDSPLVGDLLGRWPTLEELQKARPATVRQFFQQHNCRSDQRIERRQFIAPGALARVLNDRTFTGDGLALHALQIKVISGPGINQTGWINYDCVCFEE